MLSWHAYRIAVNLRKGTHGRPDIYEAPEDLHEWMTANMRGPWSWGQTNIYRQRPYFIQNKQDAMLFKLTWIDDIKRQVFPKTP
jgi:hypothetical protein